MGLVQYRDDVVRYIKIRLLPQVPSEAIILDENHPLKVATYATGTCCRKCLKVKFKLSEWDAIDDSTELKILGKIMKWTVDQVFKSEETPQKAQESEETQDSSSDI